MQLKQTDVLLDKLGVDRRMVTHASLNVEDDYMIPVPGIVNLIEDAVVWLV